MAKKYGKDRNAEQSPPTSNSGKSLYIRVLCRDVIEWLHQDAEKHPSPWWWLQAVRVHPELSQCPSASWDVFSTLAKKAPPQQQVRATLQQQQMASAKNRRLAQQMENRPTVQAALHLKQQQQQQQIHQMPLKLRLGSKGNVQARLGLPQRGGFRGRGGMRGGIRGRGRGGIRGRLSLPQFGRGAMGRGGRGGFRGAGRAALRTASGTTCPPKISSTAPLKIPGETPEPLEAGCVACVAGCVVEEGEEDGAVVHVAGSRTTSPSILCDTLSWSGQEDLDNQLDAYMSKTKGYLDAQLDEYMREAGADE
ncbi:hypothetical protein Bbelb_213920 [Branchiostoma belcheri]|nr:hypothetical protein Bbelb_213920 [Branchiostoma belcheri]